jgi:sporulation protein YpjB
MAKWFTLLLILLLVPISFVHAERTPSTMIKFDHISDEALQMVKLKRYDDAKTLLKYFSDEYLTEADKEKLFSTNELRIITVAHREALKAVKNKAISHEEKINKVTKFRLAIDAISSGEQPLWTEMEEPIMSAFREVKQAAYSGNNINFHENLNAFLSLYHMIYPSLKIDVPYEKVQSLDAKVSYIDQYRPMVLTEARSKQELEALGSDLQSIFDGMTEDEADPSLWWVIISTGSIIILTLSYVGFRKYKGDRDQKNQRKKLKE